MIPTVNVLFQQSTILHPYARSFPRPWGIRSDRSRQHDELGRQNYATFFFLYILFLNWYLQNQKSCSFINIMYFVFLLVRRMLF